MPASEAYNWGAGEAEDDEDAADLGALAAASISGAAPALSDSSVTSQVRTCAAWLVLSSINTVSPAWMHRVRWRERESASRRSGRRH